MALTYEQMDKVLMDELRLYHHPVAVTYLFTDEEVEEFKRTTPHYVPLKPTTFCQWEIAARMQNKTVLGTVDKLGCTNAQVSFGWREIDDNEVKSQEKYCWDHEQARRFLEAKPRMPLGAIKAIAVGPLGKAVMKPSAVHFYCDSMQGYTLACDYACATDTHPLNTLVMMSSAACGGSVFCYQQNTYNYSPPCSGAYNAGKTERGESHVFIPGAHIEATVERLIARTAKYGEGNSAISRPGDPFPGGDICKNCPLILFKEDKGSNPCESCEKKA